MLYFTVIKYRQVFHSFKDDIIDALININYSINGVGNAKQNGSSDFQFKGIVTDVQVGTAGNYTVRFIERV